LVRAEFPIAILLILILLEGAASQGYLGTVSTGRGILSPITVGMEEASGAQLGLSGGLNLSGNWSVDLAGGGPPRHLDLEMLQQQRLLMGWGQMHSEERSARVTATGSVRADGLTLFVLNEGEGELFRLEMSASGTAIFGVYEASSPGMPIESGTVTGRMILSAPQDQRITAISAATLPAASSPYAGAVRDLGRGSPSGQINKSIYTGQSAGAEGSVTAAGPWALMDSFNGRDCAGRAGERRIAG